MDTLVRAITRPSAGLALILGAAAAAAAGAFFPAAAAAALFGSPSFLAFAAVLAAVLVVSTYVRLGERLTARRAGSLLLHAAAALLVAGAAWDRAAGRAARVRLIEGASAALTPDGELRLRLSRLRPFTRDGRSPVGEAADAVLLAPGAPDRPARIRVNRPLVQGPLVVHLVRHGFALTLRVDGEPRMFLLDTVLDPAPRYWARAALAAGGPEAVLSFRPSPTGPFPRAPELTVMAGSGRPAARLTPGRPATVAGRRIVLDEVRYWADFRAGWQPGRRLVFASFVLAVLGAAFALLPGVLRDRG